MGATPEQQSNTSDEYPIHSVKLNNFYIGQTEVTQGLWKSIMGNNPSNFKKGDDYPVEKVSWADCIEFITKLNEKTGKEFRLPTEAEWEYAARGGGNKSLGCKFSGNNNIDEVAWYKKNSNKQTHPVAQKAENELGIYDMTGNVCEWCSDLYDIYDSVPVPQINPQGPTSSDFSHVFRGGSWDLEEKWEHISYRHANCSFNNGSKTIGFRLALNAKNNTREEDNSNEAVNEVQARAINNGEIDGHDYIDLGLPSGTLWATCNVGASSPEEFGGYYAWGETSTKAGYWWHTYKFCVGNNDHKLLKYCSNRIYGNNYFTDNLTTLEPCDDAATINWGSDWCTPTIEQFDEIVNNCTWTWTTCNKVKGCEVKGPNGNSIFFPAAGSKGAQNDCGYYFSKTCENPKYNSRALILYFKSTTVTTKINCPRKSGNPIRPVRASN